MGNDHKQPKHNSEPVFSFDEVGWLTEFRKRYTKGFHDLDHPESPQKSPDESISHESSPDKSDIQQTEYQKRYAKNNHGHESLESPQIKLQPNAAAPSATHKSGEYTVRRSSDISDLPYIMRGPENKRTHAKKSSQSAISKGLSAKSNVLEPKGDNSHTIKYPGIPKLQSQTAHISNLLKYPETIIPENNPKYKLGNYRSKKFLRKITDQAPGLEGLIREMQSFPAATNDEKAIAFRKLAAWQEVDLNRLIELCMPNIIKTAYKLSTLYEWDLEDAVSEAFLTAMEIIRSRKASTPAIFTSRFNHRMIKKAQLSWTFFPMEPSDMNDVLTLRSILENNDLDAGQVYSQVVQKEVQDRFKDPKRLIQAEHNLILQNVIRESDLLSQAELARELQVTEYALEKYYDIQTDSGLEIMPDEENEDTCLYHLIPGDDPFEENADAHLDYYQLLYKLIKRLTAREARIISLRYGLAGKPEMTLEQIGNTLHISRARVQQIEAEAIRKIKWHASRKKYRTISDSDDTNAVLAEPALLVDEADANKQAPKKKRTSNKRKPAKKTSLGIQTFGRSRNRKK